MSKKMKAILMVSMVMIMFTNATPTLASTHTLYQSDESDIQLGNVAISVKTEDVAREQLIEELIDDKMEIKSRLKRANDEEKEVLQKKYQEIVNQLGDLGVSNQIEENIFQFCCGDAGISLAQADVPEFMYGGLYEYDTYYQYVTLDGVKYTLYNVIVSDAYNNSILSYTEETSIVVCGEIKNVNQANQMASGMLEFTASAAAGFIVTNPVAGVAISTLISLIPDYEPKYLITGSNALTLTDVRVDEYVKYVYIYDAENDSWEHVLSANRARIAYSANLHYKKNKKTQSVTVTDCEVLEHMDFAKYSSEYIAKYFLLMKEDVVNSGINSIYSQQEIELSIPELGADNNITTYTHLIQLNATFEPGMLF